MRIEWAPLNVPLKRRLETFVAGVFLAWILFGELFCLFSLIGILVSVSSLIWFSFEILYFYVFFFSFQKLTVLWTFNHKDISDNLFCVYVL